MEGNLMKGFNRVRFRLLLLFTVILQVLSACPAEAASKQIRLNRKTIILCLADGKGESYRLKVVNSKSLKNSDFTWVSSDPEVVSVSSSGLITAHKKGEAVITVSHGEQRDVCRVIVKKGSGKVKVLKWKSSWKYASRSKIHSDSVRLYRASYSKGIVVAVNAGHGTKGGSNVRTLCHPDGSPKVTGGSTAAGSRYAAAVSCGAVMLDGTSESAANLSLAKLLKKQLLKEGYDVLMIREGSDVQLDNIARTVFANHYADCHISLHYDSTASNKGAFFASVPNSSSYRSMEPVASTWRKDNRLGACVIKGLRSKGVKIFGSGAFPIDLTQTSYSEIPTIDLEVGDRRSSHSEKTQTTIARGIVKGVETYFGE